MMPLFAQGGGWVGGAITYPCANHVENRVWGHASLGNFGGIWHANAPHPLPSSLKDTLIVHVTSLILSLSHAGRDYLCWL